MLDSDINELAGDFKDAVLETAEEVLGRARKKNHPWVSDDILELCDKRRALKGAKHTSEEAAAEYRQANRAVRKKMTEAKETWISKQCETIEAAMEKGNSKEAYSTLKTLTKTQQNKSTVIEDRNGELLTESTAVLER